jgi:predicted enzyme related to lactoylglutathione lyase
MPEMKTPYQPGTPCWIDLVVPDQQGALDFYARFLGWSGEIGPPETGGYSVCMMQGKPVAGVMSAKAMGDEPAPPTMWTTYFASDDADATERAIGQAGGAVLVPAMDVMSLGRMLIAADPTGAVFGVWQPKEFHGVGLANENGTLVWNELNTTDKDAASAFYAAALGLETAPMEGAKDYFSLQAGGRTVGGLQETDRPNTSSHWLVYFSVEDADRAVAELTECGGEVVHPPFDMEAGRMALVKDSQGADFAIIAVRAPATA